MLVLHPLEELEDAVLHVGHQDGLGWSRVALPSANLEQCKLKTDIGQTSIISACHLLEDKFAEDWEGALVEGIGDHSPLEVVEGAASGVHPQLHHRPRELCAQCCHLEELVVVLEELTQEVDVLHQRRVSFLVCATDHDLAVGRDL